MPQTLPLFEAMPGQGSLHVWKVLGDDMGVRLSLPNFQGWSCWEELRFTLSSPSKAQAKSALWMESLAENELWRTEG